MVVDWTGTNPQVKGAINNTLSYTKAASYTGVRSVLPPNIPNNEGVFRAIEVICPPGTVGNGVLPAACAARGLTGFRMVDCMFGALAMMLPDKVKAAGDGGNTGISIGGYDARPQAVRLCGFHLRRLGRAALGRRPRRQLAHVRQHGVATRSRSPRPSIRSQCPPTSSCRTRRAPASIRGGVPFQRDYRFLEHEGVLQVRSDRRDHRPVRPLRRQPGPPSENYLNPDTREPAAARPSSP